MVEITVSGGFLDNGETEHLAEGVGDVDCLLAELGPHAWSLALYLGTPHRRRSYVGLPAKGQPRHLGNSVAKACWCNNGSREVNRAFDVIAGDDDDSERSRAH